MHPGSANPSRHRERSRFQHKNSRSLPACSEGRAHEFHDAELPADGVHLIGIAARGREQAEEILATWEAGADDIHVEYLEDALEPGPPDTSWSPDDES